MADEGDVKNYLGVDFSKNANSSFELKQPYLINWIIKALGFDKEMNSSRNPVVKPPLYKDENGSERKHLCTTGA